MNPFAPLERPPVKLIPGSRKHEAYKLIERRREGISAHDLIQCTGWPARNCKSVLADLLGSGLVVRVVPPSARVGRNGKPRGQYVRAQQKWEK